MTSRPDSAAPHAAPNAVPTASAPPATATVAAAHAADPVATGCGTSAPAIRLHYDVEPAFYALWLDPALAYSCALWPNDSHADLETLVAADGANLAQAQMAKFDWHANSAKVTGAKRVLDLGCGFGGLMRRLVEAHQVQQVVGLTPSATQHQHICNWRDARLDARLESWQQHQPEAPYDAIISVGALEHAARLGMKSSEIRLWLDETLTYSCPLWQDGDTLEQAQMRKLDDLAIRAGAVDVARVIDIGCGWGSMLERLTGTHRVGHATGLTLANDHADYINGKIAALAAQGIRAPYEVRLESWEQHQPNEPYDAAISIGAFEHFARFGQRSAEKVASYRRFFQRCHGWLRPGAKLSLQTVAKGNTVLDRKAM